MTEHKFTDADIIKALEHYKGFRLYPFDKYQEGTDVILVDDALDLINRQRAEIERMKAGKACSIGDKLYIIVPGGGKDGGDGIEINRVTEVGERFIFFSGFAPPKDDILNNVEIADLGKEVFLDEAAFKQELERRRLAHDV